MKTTERPASHPLQGALELRGWSVVDLAEATGLTEMALSYIIRRERNPRADTLAKIARALDLPLAGLLEPWLKEELS